MQANKAVTPATPIVTGEDYINSLRGRDLRVFLFGQLVPEPVDHPMIRPSINAVAETYDLALREPDLATAKNACDWLMTAYPGIVRYQLEASMATDKKSSHMNMLHTRGKRVIAEATISSYYLQKIMRTTPEQLFEARLTSQLGGFMAGVNNNGAHSANAIAAMFIACGQDVANVAESSAAAVYADINEDGNYYFSITIPSLIVATHGGGTALPTQRECLEMLDCYGRGKAKKFAEIVAATVLCGELSLGSAAVTDEWVASHERLGRNP